MSFRSVEFICVIWKGYERNEFVSLELSVSLYLLLLGVMN
jgi:hypothetical protein